MDKTVESKSTLDAVLASTGVHRAADDAVPFVLVPAGYTAAPLESHLKAPILTRQHVSVINPDSFVDYADRFKSPNTVLFSPDFEYDKPVTMVAAIDYHGPSAPSHVKHTVTLVNPLSEQWKRWTGIDDEWLTQAQLARFLEENVFDITSPGQADMVEIVRELEATKSGLFRSGVRLSNGSTQLTWNEEVQATTKNGMMEVPEKIKIVVPVFKGDKSYEFDLWFRYRINDGKLALSVQFNRAEFLFEQIAEGLVKSIQTRVDRPLYRGAMTK